MAKLKVVGNTISEDIDELPKEIEVKEAILKDGICNYKYEQLTGPRKGNQIKESGSNLVHEDMNKAFSALNVHFAIVDNAFAATGLTKKSIDDLTEMEETLPYTVTGFKVDENDNVVLIGSKEVPLGHEDFATPKINLGGSYVFRDELKEAIDQVQAEVYAYYNGKAAPKFEQAALDFDETQEMQ
jgi:hypothetical protein